MERPPSGECKVSRQRACLDTASQPLRPGDMARTWATCHRSGNGREWRCRCASHPSPVAGRAAISSLALRLTGRLHPAMPKRSYQYKAALIAIKTRQRSVKTPDTNHSHYRPTHPSQSGGVAACSRSGHRKNLNPVPMFARFGEPIYMRPAAMRAVSFCSALPALLRKMRINRTTTSVAEVSVRSNRPAELLPAGYTRDHCLTKHHEAGRTCSRCHVRYGSPAGVPDRPRSCGARGQCECQSSGRTAPTPGCASV
jgi:hypothetical protein